MTYNIWLQMCFAYPERIAGMSAGSSLLGIVGNGLMIPRALFTRDFIWYGVHVEWFTTLLDKCIHHSGLT